MSKPFFSWFYLLIYCATCYTSVHHFFHNVLQSSDELATQFEISGRPEHRTLRLNETLTLSCPSSFERIRILEVQVLPDTVSIESENFIRRMLYNSCFYHTKCQLTPALFYSDATLDTSRTITVSFYFVCVKEKIPHPTRSPTDSSSELPLTDFSGLHSEAPDNFLRLSPLAHLQRQSRLFLILNGLTASCTEIPYTPTFTTGERCVNEAQNRCLDAKSCHMVIQDSRCRLCSDASLNSVEEKVNSAIFLKGSTVLQDLPHNLDFYIFLNLQAICEEENVLEQHENVQSLDEALRLCHAHSFCEYFVMTTESGLSAKKGIRGPLPNSLWLCRRPDLQGNRNTNSLTSVGLFGTISGFSSTLLIEVGLPEIIGSILT